MALAATPPSEKVRQNKEDDSDDEYAQAIKAMDKLSCKNIGIDVLYQCKCGFRSNDKYISVFNIRCLSKIIFWIYSLLEQLDFGFSLMKSQRVALMDMPKL